MTLHASVTGPTGPIAGIAMSVFLMARILMLSLLWPLPGRRRNFGLRQELEVSPCSLPVGWVNWSCSVLVFLFWALYWSCTSA
jgi:hypothetical protein